MYLLTIGYGILHHQQYRGQKTLPAFVGYIYSKHISRNQEFSVIDYVLS